VSDATPVSQRLLDSIDQSKAVAYVKALDGRYLCVNKRFEELLMVAAEELLGREDAELEPRRTIDGPRLACGGISEHEPLQLEYTVAPFEGRPALAVWRFAVWGADDEAVAVCGVAAPIPDAALARSECERLMAIAEEGPAGDVGAAERDRAPVGDSDGHRIAALQEASASATRRAQELLKELTEERERRAEAEARAAEGDELRRLASAAEAAALAERTQAAQARAELNAARDELASVRGRLERADAAAQREAARAAEADAAARREAERADTATVEELRRKLAEAVADLDATRALLDSARANADATAMQERERAQAADSALAAARADAEIRISVAERRIAELEGSLAEARANELEAASDRASDGPYWDSSAQRAFTTALAYSSDWRIGVKSALGVIGGAGGWDAVCAWQPDDRNGFASCFAMWTGETRRLSALETATWQRRQPLTDSTIGQALTWEESRWLAADSRAADRRLQLLAQQGIRGALIVPVKDGARPVAALELLTAGVTPPSKELTEALETVALQLGHFWHLLSAGAQPRWRFGHP
jgi:hypothetical protein